MSKPQQTIITSIGIDVLKELIKRKTEEMNELLEEIKNLRDSQSSTEDNPDIAVVTTRYEKVIQERNELSNVLSEATIIDVTKITTEKVVFGSVVSITDLDTDETFTYRIVSPIESDIGRGLISYESPIGRAMIGLREGDCFDFDVRSGTKEYEINKIEAKEI